MKPIMLIILDGFGIGKNEDTNAAYIANTPTIDNLYKNVATATLEASGLAVGLPEGQMGNSEVGHLNIGAGRVVYQNLTRISKAVEDESIYSNKVFLEAVENAKKNNSALHLMGLVSHGGVHSHIDHLVALLKLAKKENLEKVYIHAILDGRDVPPNIGIKDLKELQDKINEIGIGKIASVSGRYYAMDRDKRWERTEKAYDAYTIGEAEKYSNVEDLIKSNYDRDIFDEFVLPGVITENDEAIGKINENDSLIFFNFRPDRARQIVRAFTDPSFDGFQRKKQVKVYMATMTEYDKTIPNTNVAFGEIIPENTLGEVLAKNNKKQLRIAETEKYAHVTFFFNGGREEKFDGEDRVLIPSPKVATYDLQPEMSAEEVTENVVERIESEKYDVIILNFANPDMVGHTGVIPAAKKAVETVDTCLGKILKSLDKVGGAALITADHGNCELMRDEEGNVVTSHSTNKVPLFLYGAKDKNLKDGKLCDLSPTILKLLDIEQPEEMTGKSLI